MTANRTDPERHKSQVRAANRARHRAVKRLIDLHPAEYDVLYADEARKEGVEAKPRVASDVAQLQTQINQLRAELADKRKPQRTRGARASR